MYVCISLPSRASLPPSSGVCFYSIPHTPQGREVGFGCPRAAGTNDHLLKQQKFFFRLTLLARSPKSRCCQGHAPSEASGGGSFLASSSFWWSPVILGWWQHHSNLSSIITWQSSLCVSCFSVFKLPFLIRTAIFGLGSTLILWASLVAQKVKNLFAMQDPWVGKIPWGREWQPT